MGRLGAEESSPHEAGETSASLDLNAEAVSVDNGPYCTEHPSQGIYTDQGEFLRAIHLTFLDLVQPIQSGLTDELRAVGAIDVDGEEKIMAEKTTRDKARALWVMLHHVPPRLFGEKCMPILKTLYSHVLEGAEYRWDEKPDLTSTCLHHAIMTRMTIKRFADVFPSTTGCSLQEYKNILENKSTSEDQWKPVFCLVKQNHTNEKLVARLLHILEGIGVDCQGDCDWLKRQLESGLSCTCISKPQDIDEDAEYFHEQASGDIEMLGQQILVRQLMGEDRSSSGNSTISSGSSSLQPGTSGCNLADRSGSTDCPRPVTKQLLTATNGRTPAKMSRVLGNRSAPATAQEDGNFKAAAVGFLQQLQEQRKNPANPHIHFAMAIAEDLCKIQSSRRLAIVKHKINGLVHEALMEEMSDNDDSIP